MINKYVCFIDVDEDTGEVNIDGLEKAMVIDYLSISKELLYQYEQLVRNFVKGHV